MPHPGQVPLSGLLPAAADAVLRGDAEPAAPRVQDRDAVPGAGLGEAEEGIAAIAAAVAACSGADLAADVPKADDSQRPLGLPTFEARSARSRSLTGGLRRPAAPLRRQEAG